MKKLLAAMLLLSSLVLHPALAANEQQNKMATCNKEAADKKGDERKKFMSECLGNKPASAQKTQKEKMKSCNVEAAGKKGDERKKFMSECLKKD